MSEQEIESEIKTKGLNAPRLTPALIDSTIVSEDFHVFEGGCLTVCCLTLVNGFTVSGESACASAENFDVEIGKKISRENARNKIWQLEGYLLKQKIFKKTFIVFRIAEVCHMANKAYCESQGDMSQPNWDDAPDWQKQSAVNGVEFHLDNENTTPADSHNSWLKEKREDGWVYGEVKNPELKTHPCMVEYDELPANQKAKDYIFKAIVDSMSD